MKWWNSPFAYGALVVALVAVLMGACSITARGCTGSGGTWDGQTLSCTRHQ